uniref:Integrase core domain containing protein n=1 Tax=Solanum tuberosum TaxID=4113 RepID=M1DS51_SOLTU
MDPKKAPVYAAKGMLKSVAPSFRLSDEDTNPETDPAYVPPTTSTSPTTLHTIRNQTRSNGTTTSSFESTSVRDILVPPNTDLAPVVEEPNRWCVSGQWQIFQDPHMLSEKERMARLVTEEHKDIVRSGVFQRNAAQKETLWHWLARHLATDGERTEWLYMDAGVPVWFCDKLVQATKTLDIGLIWDEANVAAPWREPQVELPPLGADLVVGWSRCRVRSLPLQPLLRMPQFPILPPLVRPLAPPDPPPLQGLLPCL